MCYQSFVKVDLELNHDSPGWLLSALNSGSWFAVDRYNWAKARGRLKSDSGRVFEEAKIRYETTLRGYVDDWIASGYGNGDRDVEHPRSRNIEILSVGGSLGDLPNGVQAANRFLKRNPPTPHFRRDGGLTLTFPGEEISLDADDPTADAEREAARYFAMFLISDWRFRITRCAGIGCGIYYLRERPRAFYKRKTYCASCRNKQTAMARTAKKRVEAKDKLYGFAAKKFGRQIAGDQNWAEDVALKRDIASYLDRRVRAGARLDRKVELRSLYPRGIQVNWVSLRKNASGIEKAVRDLNATR
jgi:hypothetical protein